MKPKTLVIRGKNLETIKLIGALFVGLIIGVLIIMALLPHMMISDEEILRLANLKCEHVCVTHKAAQ